MNVLVATPLRRRVAILAAALAVIALALGTVRLAAAWRADAAPLAQAPVTIDAIQARSEDETQRANALLDQIHGLDAQVADLRAALVAAGQQVVGDTADAQQLRTELDAARTRLAGLEAQLAEARKRLAAGAAQPVAAAAAREDEHERHEDEHEERDGHDD